MKLDDAICRVHTDNVSRMVADPDGDYPICKPALRKNHCERCGRPLPAKGACPGVPISERWRILPTVPLD